MLDSIGSSNWEIYENILKFLNNTADISLYTYL